MHRMVLSKQAGNTIPLLLWSAVLCLGAVLAARRAVGGFAAPENSFPACITGSIVLMAHTWACLCSAQNGFDSTNKQFHATWLGALCFPFAVAAPLLPIDSTFAIMYLLTQAAVATCALVIVSNDATISGHWQQLFDNSSADSIPIPFAQKQLLLNQTKLRNTPQSQTPQPQLVQEFPSQQIQRITSGDGSECVTGTVQLQFLPGQKQTTAHILFSPPLPSLPTFEFETDGDNEIRIKPALIQLYGVRIEAHSSSPMGHAHNVLVTFKATSKKPQLNAA